MGEWIFKYTMQDHVSIRIENVIITVALEDCIGYIRSWRGCLEISGK